MAEDLLTLNFRVEQRGILLDEEMTHITSKENWFARVISQFDYFWEKTFLSEIASIIRYMIRHSGGLFCTVMKSKKVTGNNDLVVARPHRCRTDNLVLALCFPYTA